MHNSFSCVTTYTSHHVIAKRVMDNIDLPNVHCGQKYMRIDHLHTKQQFILKEGQQLLIQHFMSDKQEMHTPSGYLKVVMVGNKLQLFLTTKYGRVVLADKIITTGVNKPSDTCSNLPNNDRIRDNTFVSAIDDLLYFIYQILFTESCASDPDDNSYTSNIIRSFSSLKQALIPVLMFFAIFNFIYVLINQILYQNMNFVELSYDLFRFVISIILLQSSILDFLAKIIIYPIMFLIDMGMIKYNLCSDAMNEDITFFHNIECFIVKLLFGSTDVMFIITRIVMVVLGLIVSFIFPVHGIVYALLMAISIILLMWIMFWIFSFIVNIATNIILQIITVVLLLYISPMIIALWPIEKYIKANYFDEYCNSLINNIMTIPILVLFANIFIYILYNTCEYYSLFSKLDDVFNSDEDSIKLFFGIISIGFIVLAALPDIASIVMVFCVTALIMQIYSKIINFFTSRITRVSIMVSDFMNTEMALYMASGVGNTFAKLSRSKSGNSSSRPNPSGGKK
ncbi:MAG: hypothetical protein AAFO15_01170 [Pseudomonadota bacterium]